MVNLYYDYVKANYIFPSENVNQLSFDFNEVKGLIE